MEARVPPSCDAARAQEGKRRATSRSTMSGYLSIRYLMGMLMLVVVVGLCLLLASSFSAARPDVPVSDLGAVGRYYVADGSQPPAKADELAAWLKQRKPLDRISLFGGDYWLYAEILVGDVDPAWVFDTSNSLVQHVEARIDGPDGARQTLVTGYEAPHEFLLHYGKEVQLSTPGRYQVLVHFSSPYFRSFPRFELWPLEAYRQHVLTGNVIVLACLGALAALAVFNFFLFITTGERSQLSYASYLVFYGIGWAFVFNLPAELFRAFDLRWNYIPFFLLPILNTLFYTRFLDLRQRSPRLARWSRINIVLPLLLLPSCFFALSYAHALATVAIAIWLVLAVISGVTSLRDGYRPARFFVPAFISLIIPAVLILPANLGLIPDVVDNELFTLLGGTLDGLLLAFAVADRFRMISEQKDLYMRQLNHALELANTDGLTGVGNRYAFDEYIKQEFVYDIDEGDAGQVMVLIDLDGLKGINDRLGHSVGDDLLRKVAQTLQRRLEPVGKVFRLGGDEFSILSIQAQLAFIEATLEDVERDLVQAVSIDAGMSYGIAYAHEVASPAMLVTQADTRMYLAKSSRKVQRLRLA